MPHLVVHSDAPQGSAEWLEARKKGITSTEISAALGVSPYKTPLQLYHEKVTGVSLDDDNWYMARGRAMEPVLREHYARKFGRNVIVQPGVVRNPDLDFMLASLDGYTDDERLAEFKTASTRRGWGEPGTDEIPQVYILQVQYAMIVTGFRVADVGVSFAGQEPQYYEVNADYDLQALIIKGAMEFWENLQAGIEPEPSTIEEMQRKYKITDGKTAIVDRLSVLDDIALIKNSKAVISEQEKLVDVAKENICGYMLQLGVSTLTDRDGNKLVTWNESKGATRFDAKRFSSEHPELYAEYTVQGEPARRFLLR